MISCLIVNLNCAKHTENLIKDLERQTYNNFDITVVDQNSTEPYTKILLNSLTFSGYNIIKNSYNKPLNLIWNEFIRNSKNEYCSFLNNDIRIPYNFLDNTKTILDIEPSVSCVIHPTNHPNWFKTRKILSYDILDDRTRQGWDFTFRKSHWTNIPKCLDFYCGDDFIFENIYNNDHKVAMATSSPVIHLLGQTRKSPLNTIIPNRNPIKDIEEYKKLGYRHYLNVLDKYSKIEPEIAKIFEEIE
jgi:glycosyltransferase involved in cell wall biosynthesis